MRIELRRGRRITRTDRYTAVVLGCLLLAAVLSWSSVLLVVRGHVIPGWAVSAAWLVVSLTLMRVLAVRHRSAAGGTTSPRPAPPRFVRGSLVAAAGLGSAFGAAADLDAEYYVLHPQGPGGCTAVVRETSFLLTGGGEVYAVGPTGIAWQPSGSWTVDDGYRPVAAGTYELRWSSSGGTLTVRGTQVDPVMQGLHGVDCD